MDENATVSAERVSPNRVGLFATFGSLLIFAIGAILVVTAPSFGDSFQRSAGGLLVVIGLVGTLFSYALVRLYFWSFRPPISQRVRRSISPVAEPVGLGGWLILVALGLLLTPLRGIVQMSKDFSGFDFAALSAPLQLLIGAEFLLNLALMLVAPVILLWLMRRLDHRFPIFYVRWLLAVLAFNILDILAIYLMFKSQVDAGQVELFDRETVVSLATAILVALIWIPYMKVSRRVRNTFTLGAARRSES